MEKQDGKIETPQLKAAVGVFQFLVAPNLQDSGNFLNIFSSAFRLRQAGLVLFCRHRLKWRSSATLD